MFSYKKLQRVERGAGAMLRQAREDQGWTLEQASGAAGVPFVYAQALEENHYALLPSARAYRLAYVRQYARTLRCNVTACEERFTKDGALTGLTMRHPFRAIRYFPFHSFSTFVRCAAAVIFVGAFVGYLGWQVSGVVKPPRLQVDYPSEGTQANFLHTIVTGTTEPESKLTVNGTEVMVTPQGQFSLKIDLVRGLNTITIEATKKHGRATTITRHIIAQPGPVAVNGRNSN